jgi:hypothetical protein
LASPLKHVRIGDPAPGRADSCRSGRLPALAGGAAVPSTADSDLERPQGALGSPRRPAAGLPAEPIDLAMKLTVLLDTGGAAMWQTEVSIQIQAPIEQVYRRLSDFTRHSEFSDGLAGWSS